MRGEVQGSQGEDHGRSMKEPEAKKGDRVVWNRRTGTVMDIDTSAQNTPQGRAFGGPFAAWVLFDDRASDPNAWTCVNAFDCRVVKKDEEPGR